MRVKNWSKNIMQIKRIALGGIIMTVIMFTPTYACVGTSDGIASYRSMEKYISQETDRRLSDYEDAFCIL